MRERFSDLLDEEDSIIDYCNATMYSIGNVQIPLGIGRIYLTLRGLFFYAKHLSLDIKLFISFDEIISLELQQETGILIKYNQIKTNKNQSRFFTFSSSNNCERIYNWMISEWNRKNYVSPSLNNDKDNKNEENCLITIISPRSELLNFIINHLNDFNDNKIDIRLILIDFKYSIDPFLIPIPSHTDAQYQKQKNNLEIFVVPIHSKEAIKTALFGTNVLIYIPPLPEMFYVSKIIKKIILSKEISKLKYFLTIFPYFPEQIYKNNNNLDDLNHHNIKIYPETIKKSKNLFQNLKEKFNKKYKLNHLNVTVFEVFPLFDLFEIFTNCDELDIFLPYPSIINNHQCNLIWSDLFSISKIIVQFIFNFSLRKISNYIISSSKQLNSNDLLEQFNKILDKQFKIYNSKELIMERIENLLRFSYFENRCIEEYIEIITTYNNLYNNLNINKDVENLIIQDEKEEDINEKISSSIENDDIDNNDLIIIEDHGDISKYLLREFERFQELMNFIILTNKESNFISELFLSMYQRSSSTSTSSSSSSQQQQQMNDHESILIDAPKFIEICGCFLNYSGLSTMLFHALMNEKKHAIDIDGFKKGIGILLHGTKLEKNQFLFKMFQSSSNKYFSQEDVKQIVCAMDVFFLTIENNVNKNIITKNDDDLLPIDQKIKSSIPLHIELIEEYLLKEFNEIINNNKEQLSNIDIHHENKIPYHLFELFIERTKIYISSLGAESILTSNDEQQQQQDSNDENLFKKRLLLTNSNIHLKNINKNQIKRIPGIPILFGHKDWDQVWNLMLGIEISVQRLNKLSSKIREKDSFNDIEYIIGEQNNKLSNTKELSTKWIINDYAPLIFKKIRDYFGISSNDFLNSLGPQKFIGDLLTGNWSCYHELKSSGRSGSVFYSSHDGRFFIKTLPDDEEILLRKNLASYYYYVTSNPNTLLTRFYGLFKIKKGSKGTWMNVVIMENLFSNSSSMIHEIYDLKGSTVNRHVELTLSQEELPSIARKDNDFSRILKIGSFAKNILLEVIEQDILWMQTLNITDYSLLVGLKSLESKDLQATTLQTKIESGCGDFKDFFKLYDGGILSVDRKEVYYIGLIDILGEYNLRKKGEFFVKSLIHSPQLISASPPIAYRKRFQKYVTSIIE